MMKFFKNKAKVILYYLTIYFSIAILLAVIVALLSNKNDVIRIIMMEFMVVSVIGSLLKLHIAEVKQTVEIGKNEIICENFIVNGNVANGKIDYSLVETITLKKVPLKPFSRCLFITLKNSKPITITDDYINYQEMWYRLCNNCKAVNPYVYIDKKIAPITGRSDNQGTDL